MKKITLIMLILLAFGCSVTENSVSGDNWPQWRGPLATGEAPEGNPPVKWSETQNLKWKVEIPGSGKSTPVIWGEKLFLTTAIETEKVLSAEEIEKKKQELPAWQRGRGRAPNAEYQFVLLCLERNSGKVLWKKVLHQDLPHAGTHQDGTWASPSAATDGQYVVAFFGSNGLYCLDLEGNEIWRRDLGNMNIRASFGEGSSPVLYGDRLIVNWDHEGDSYIFVLDKKTGKDIWKAARDEMTSWSTPIVGEYGGKIQLIVSATSHVQAYDLDTGDVLWKTTGMTENVIPSPIYSNGLVYAMSGFRGAALQAIRLDKASGDIAGTGAVAWTHNQDTPYTPSPLLYGGLLYFFARNSGTLTCLDAGIGNVVFGPQKLENVKGVYASPVGAADRVYIAGRQGNCVVIKNTRALEVLAVNKLDEDFDASPVVVGKSLYLRGAKYLYCIEE